MKYIIITITIAFTLLTSVVDAQNLKFAHINSNELLLLMPEISDADAKLQKFGQELDNQLKTMSGEYTAKLGDFQGKQAMMADAVRESKERELVDLQNRIQEFQVTAQESIIAKREELYAPVIKRAEDAIQSIAKEKGYSYVFDTSTGSVLYAQEGDDIMSMVKQRLGL